MNFSLSVWTWMRWSLGCDFKHFDGDLWHVHSEIQLKHFPNDKRFREKSEHFDERIVCATSSWKTEPSKFDGKYPIDKIRNNGRNEWQNKKNPFPYRKNSDKFSQNDFFCAHRFGEFSTTTFYPLKSKYISVSLEEYNEKKTHIQFDPTFISI